MIDYSKKVKIEDQKSYVIDKHGYVYKIKKYKYNPETKHTDDSRICVGKIVDNKNQEFYPNDKYLQDNQKNVQCEEEIPSIDTYLHVGQYLALQESAKHFGLYEALKKAFPKLCSKILALAYFSIDSEDSTAQHYSKWGFSNFSGIEANFSSGNISEIFSQIGSDDNSISEFLKEYIRLYSQSNFIKERKVIAFDSTNQNTTADQDNMTLAEYGKAKKDIGVPIINTAFFVDELTGIPVSYESFYGSLLDKVQAPESFGNLENLGFNKVFYMMDRGYFTENNLKMLKEKNIDFGMMLPEHLQKVKDIFDNFSDIKDRENAYISEENVYGQLINNEPDENGLFYYFYYDPETAEDEKNTIHSKAIAIKNSLEKPKVYYSQKLAEKYEKFYSLVPIGKRGLRKFSIVKNTKSIQTMIDRAGLFVVVSNTKMSPKEMIVIARNRDKVEKSFKRIKSHFYFDSISVHKDVTFRGKMLVAFVACAIISTFEFLVKKYLKKSSSITIFTALAELSKIIIYKNKNHRYLKYAFNAKSKEILSLVGVDRNYEKKLLKFDTPYKLL